MNTLLYNARTAPGSRTAPANERQAQDGCTWVARPGRVTLRQTASSLSQSSSIERPCGRHDVSTLGETASDGFAFKPALDPTSVCTATIVGHVSVVLRRAASSEWHRSIDDFPHDDGTVFFLNLVVSRGRCVSSSGGLTIQTGRRSVGEASIVAPSALL